MSQFMLQMKIAGNATFSPGGSTLFNRHHARAARAFHSKLPGYQPTPLRLLPAFAQALGVHQVMVKDESQRFGLNAFKMLGGAWAIACLLCEEYNLDIGEFSFESFRRQHPQPLTFTTTTDGNHGRGVAWAAQQLGQHAVIYMPKGSSAARVKHITDLGADCIVTEMNYDDTVRLTIGTAEKNGWKVVQDTAWQDYTRVPTWIMQGYATLADEAVEQIAAAGMADPTHLFLQAGVGAMAAGVLGYFSDVYGAGTLHAVVVEPDKADCLFRSAQRGEIVNVAGEMNTIMAGLACGEPNPLGWPVLKNCVQHFISCEDRVAALGMRVLGNPLGDDPRIISGESGAVSMGVLAAILHHPQAQELKDQLKLTATSRVLLLSTEGDTDPQHYREVVWEGKDGITASN
ncbi:diaminopropionate ammonia-lyase [Pantoea sp. BAV 3049]|uniref:diaminopropionate ammonia-lyase n=1 Tax=Pantoea sp. BAV 3049 TaxID=2654188 RepID=UPI00131BFBE6|nr:diaminopropionate ammonia-lyase [Pantoea sp. BAV 3049]